MRWDYLVGMGLRGWDEIMCLEWDGVWDLLHDILVEWDLLNAMKIGLEGVVYMGWDGMAWHKTNGIGGVV